MPAAELVPGDVVLLADGDRLSADARLTDGSVEVNMAALTDETQPVVRSASAVPGALTPCWKSEESSASRARSAGGEAEGVVYATGRGTQLGRIAALSRRVKPEISPLSARSTASRGSSLRSRSPPG